MTQPAVTPIDAAGQQALLDDHPASAGSDRLRFGRYVEALDQLVLQRASDKALVTAIYGPWGSGKSSLLELVKQRLEDINKKANEERDKIEESRWTGFMDQFRGRSAEDIRQATERFKVVEFSPWLYRNEKSLMVPLLVTLAKRNRAFQDLFGDIMDAAPQLTQQVIDLAGKVAVAGAETAATGLPLITILSELRARKKTRDKDTKGPIQELTEKIEAAVKSTVKNNQRIVFLIDDLDRCHDPAQVVGLLEQIKLLLHFDRCLFFIAADRQQIVAAIEKLFPGSGNHYLEKFVQVGVEVLPHTGDDLVALLPPHDAPERSFFRRLAPVVGNPRQFKQIYNQAVMLRKLVGQHIDSTATLKLRHQPSLILAAKCIVLRELTAFGSAEGRGKYIAFEGGRRDEAARASFFEAMAPKSDAPPPVKVDRAQATGAKARNIALRCKSRTPTVPAPSAAMTPAKHALASFLWLDMQAHSFASSRVLGLYATLDGEGREAARHEIELAVSEGKYEFAGRDFTLEDFSDARFAGARFVDCRFTGTSLARADLGLVRFIRCSFDDVDMTQAQIEGIHWQDGSGRDTIIADAETIGKLALQWLARNEAPPATPPPESSE